MTRTSSLLPGAPRAAALAGLLPLALAAAGPAPAQQTETEWECFRSWTVTTVKESEIFRVDRSSWALRWRRTTPTHTRHDGLFAELYRAEDGERTRDQAAAVNTDHAGHRGTVTVDESGAFWIAMESWSEETAWELEACLPAKEPGRRGAPAAGAGSDPG